MDRRAVSVRLAALRPKIKRPLTIALIAYAVYLALMMLVAMPLLNWLAPRLYQQQTGRELRFDNIVVNPFKLSVSAHSPASDNPDGSPFWSAELVRVDLSLASLWRWHLVLDELWINGLEVQVEQTAPDRYNFSDILDYRAEHAEPEPEPEPKTAEPFEISIDWLLLSARRLGLRAPHLGEPLAVELDELALTVADFTTVAPDDYAPPADALPPAGAGHVELLLGRLQYDSLRRQDPYSTHADGLRLVLDDVTTFAEPGQPYTLAVRGENGGQLRWRGELSLAAGRSAGQLRLDNVDLLPVWRHFKPRLRFDAHGARLDFSGDYRASWGEGPLDYGIDNGRAALREVQLQGRADAASSLGVGAFSVDGIRLDGGRRQLAVAAVGLTGLRLKSWNDADKTPLLDMLSLASTAGANPANPPATANPAGAKPPAATTTPAPAAHQPTAAANPGPAANPPSKANAPAPAATPPRIAGPSAGPAHPPPAAEPSAGAAPSTAEPPAPAANPPATANAPTAGSSAAATSPPPAASPPAATAAGSETAWQLAIATVTVDDAEVRWRAEQLAAPELVVALTARATDVRYPQPAPAKLALDATVNDATTLQVEGELTPASLDGELRGELKGLPLAWGNRLLAEQLTAKLASGELAAHWRLTLAEGSPARFAADGEIDRFELQRTPGDRKLLAWNKLRWQQLEADLGQRRLTLRQVSLAAPWAQFRINADGTNNFQRLVRRPTAAAAPPATETAPAPEPAGPDWQLLVENIRLDDGRLDFRDVSMPVPFHAVIGDFGGVVKGLGSDRDRAARVDLAGTVDGYAPVTLTGTASPLAEPPALDLALRFNNIDLATLTPYSGTYAGYAIDHGQLTVALDYTLENNRIKGSNRVVVDQLVLGEKVESPKAVDLPLRLAIALLTDEHGVMNLGVDITGNIDDPQFDLGSIIWKAFRNLIVKAATAPFRLLAGLVGGNPEKFGEIDFAPGSSALDDDARGRLAKLKKALEQRPSLRLALTGHVDPERDGEALRLQVLNIQLQKEEGLEPEDIEERSRSWRNAIEDRYEERFPDRDIDDRTPQQLLPELVSAIALKPGRLDALAAQRALAAKRTLVVELGLPPERVFISGDSGGKQAKVQQARVTMGVDGH